MIHKLNKEVAIRFKTWTIFSKILGYKENSAKLWMLNNIYRWNKKLKPLGFELDVKEIKKPLET